MKCRWPKKSTPLSRRALLFENQVLEVKSCTKLYLARSKDDRVVDSRRLTVQGVIGQGTGREINRRDICLIRSRDVGTIKEVEALSQKFKVHVLLKPDPL